MGTVKSSEFDIFRKPGDYFENNNPQVYLSNMMLFIGINISTERLCTCEQCVVFPPVIAIGERFSIILWLNFSNYTINHVSGRKSSHIGEMTFESSKTT